MSPLVTLFTGPPGAWKTDRLLERYREVLSTAPPGSTLWLAPTSRAAAEIRSRLLGGQIDGCFAPGITTFARFAETVLQRSPRPVRPLSGLLKRQLIRQLIADEAREGRLQHFGPIVSTSGLLDLLCDFIRQMKRLEIWPDQFAVACRQRGMTEKDRELLGIYQAYQQKLVDHDLYDAEGCFWSARDLLRQRPIEYAFIVADGFSDFTRTEHDMLQDLTAHAGEVWISLPLEESRMGFSPSGSDDGLKPILAGREDLFKKPRKTLEELRKRHANLRVETVTRPAMAAWPAMDHIERTIFSNPRTMTPAADTAGLEILAGGRLIGEIEMIGRRIKRLLRTHHAPRDGLHHAERDEYVRPEQIAVVFRQPQPVADLVSEVFQRLEIPFYVESGRSLSRSPPVVMLLRLLELDADDWPMHKLLGVLGNNYFAPDWAEWNDHAPGLAEQTIRGLQIPRGRERLLEQAAHDVGQAFQPDKVGQADREYLVPEPDKPSQAGKPDLRVHTLLRRLADAFDRLPHDGALAEYAVAWQELAEQLGIVRQSSRQTPSAVRQKPPASEKDSGRHSESACYFEDQAAWKQLHDTLRRSQQLAACLGQDAPRLDRKQAREVLLDILNHQEMDAANAEPGRVRVLSAASARHLQTPYLFLAGLSEKSFPAAEGDDGVYSQAERQRLIDAGLPISSRSDRQSDEMLLFYETITSATRRLYLSYPAIGDSGEPLSASPYLKEVEQACGDSSPIARVAQADLSPVPDADEVCSLDAFRVRAVFEATQGKAELLAGFEEYCNLLLNEDFGERGRDSANTSPTRQRGNDANRSPTRQRGNDANTSPTRQQGGEPTTSLARRASIMSNSPSDSLLRGLEFSLLRQNREHFVASEGMLSPLSAGWLDADFPPQRIFSATELEGYAYCPYRFFLEKVLEVKPLEEVELEVDYMQRGQTAHALLAAFHRRVNQFAGRAESPAVLAVADYERLLGEALAETVSQPGRDSLADTMREIDRRILLDWIESYREQHAKYDVQGKDCDLPPRPALFEISFGRALREGDGPPSTAEPLELISHNLAVRIAGRIDRIDLGEIGGRAIFNILDYKTGGGTRFSLEACRRGTVLQLPLYALAAAELIVNDRDATPWQAGYWYLSGDGFKPRQALRMYELADGHLCPTEPWEEIRGILADTVIRLVKAMRQGQFPVYSDDPDCTGRCPYKTVCRINQIRSLEKKWPPHAP